MPFHPSDTPAEHITDPIDQATATEELFLRAALRAHAEQAADTGEAPDEDDKGNRYCLDCGEIISPERRAIMPKAIRCVSCLSRRERLNRPRGTGGILSLEDGM